MKRYKTFSIVIPAYNEEATIEQLFNKVIKADTLGLKKEIIVVDDGSTDKTLKILKKLKQKYKSRNNKLFIYSKKNGGKTTALKYGFKKTTGDIVIVQDADLEYDPNDYAKMLDPFITKKADVVYGSRLLTSEAHRVMYYWHSVVNKFLTTLSNMFTNMNMTDMETCYKCFRGEIIRKLAPSIESLQFGFEPEITAKIAKIKDIRIFEVGISYSGRTYEEGKKIYWKDGVRAIWEIIKFNLEL